MNPSLVTVVIATYKAGEHLKQAIFSSLKQTHECLEVIVSDDADSSSVKSLVESFDDQRVRYRSNPTRMGPAVNHWNAFREARGKYLAILNHDDFWNPNFLSRLVPPLERYQDIVLAFCDHNVVDIDGQIIESITDQTSQRWGRDKLAPGRHHPFTDLVVAQTIPLAMGSVFRAAALNLDALPDVGPAYDLWTTYELSRGGSASWYAPERLTAWRVHPSQITGHGNSAWASGSVACWSAMERDTEFKSFKASIGLKLGNGLRSMARYSFRDGDLLTARRCARMAIARRWYDWRAWACLGLSLTARTRKPKVIGN